MSIDRVLELLFGQVGLLFALIFILWAGFRGYWVWGTYAAELRDRIEKLEARLDRAGKVAESGTGLASRATRLVEDRQTEVPGG